MKKILFICIIILLKASAVLCADPVELNTDLNGKYIGLQLEYFEDVDKIWTINEIAGKQLEKQFQQSDKKTLNFGVTSKSAYWIRFKTLNKLTYDQEWYLEYEYPLSDLIELYFKKEDKFQVVRMGDHFPFKNRELEYKNFIFSLTDSPGIQTYYLRVETSGMKKIPLKAWTKSNLIKHMNSENIINGLIYGFLFLLVFYNLFIYFSVKDLTYLYLSFGTLGFSLAYLAFDGYGFQYLWPDLIKLTQGSVWFYTISAIFLVLFIRGFLESKKHSPGLDRAITVFIAIGTVYILLFPMLPYSTYQALFFITIWPMTLIAGIIVVYLSIRSINRGDTAGKFFLLTGIAVYAILGRLTLFEQLGWAPSNLFIHYSDKIGLSTAMTLFSLALADKIRAMRDELALVNVQLKDLNLNLEDKVALRTEELIAANEEMRAMNDELVKTRDILWGEMELAKKIQTVLLPEDPAMKGYRISVHMSPADDVGGDYYDVIKAGGMDWVVIGDVSGHGVPAGIVMMMVQTAIHANLDHNPGLEPSKLLTLVNRTIYRNIKRLNDNKYMTITVFALIKDGSFIYSGMHQDILVYRKQSDEVESVPTYGMWIGIIPELEGSIQNNTINLDPGDIMLLYTDGIIEAWISGSVKGQRDPEKDMYGLQKLKDVFKGACKEGPVGVKDAVLDSLTGYVAHDDVTLMVIERVYDN